MTTHKLKLPEPYFTEVLEGRKTFEIRRNDRGYQRGDTLVLWDVTSCACGSDTCPRVRPSIERRISFVFSGDPNLRDAGGVVPGYVVLALEPTGTGCAPPSKSWPAEPRVPRPDPLPRTGGARGYPAVTAESPTASV